jgi:ParB family chromosome partitioning protein
MAKLGMLRNVKERSGTSDNRSVTLAVKDIPIGDIAIKGNVRKEYIGINELADSIRQHGLLQPITVHAEGDGYAVKTGHRRYLAYKTLYAVEPERFHSIRCIVSDADNRAVLQLVENVQRVDLSQLELYEALSMLRKQGMALKQIAEVMGKTEKYIKNLFVGINEIARDKELEVFIDSPAGGTIQDVADTKGITDKQERLNLLDQRKSGSLTRADMRKKVKELKAPQLKTESPQKTALTLQLFTNLNEIIIRTVDGENKKCLASVGKDLQRYFSQSEKYCLGEKSIQKKPQGGKK